MLSFIEQDPGLAQELTPETKTRLVKVLKKLRYNSLDISLRKNPAATFSFIFSLISLLVGLIFSIGTGFESLMSGNIHPLRALGVLSLFYISLGLLFRVFIVYSRSYIKKCSKEEYAEVIIASLTEAECLAFVSYRLFVETRAFLSAAEVFFLELGLVETEKVVREEKFNLLVSEKKIDLYSLSPLAIQFIKNRPQRAESGITQDVKRIASSLTAGSVSKFKGVYSQVEQSMQRLDYLVVQLGQRLNIPAEELMEHYFRISPKLYCIHMSKLISDYRSIEKNKNVFEKKSGNAPNAFYHLTSRRIGESLRFYVRRKEELKYLCQNILFDDLQDTIIALGSCRSSSEALKHYVDGLQLCAGRNTDASTNPASARYTQARLKYYFPKRQVYPGFDVHQLLCRILKSDFDITIRNCIKNTHLDSGEHEALTKILDELFYVQQQAADLHRTALKAKFKEWYHNFNPVGKRTIFIALGISKNARSIIKDDWLMATFQRSNGINPSGNLLFTAAEPGQDFISWRQVKILLSEEANFFESYRYEFKLPAKGGKLSVPYVDMEMLAKTVSHSCNIVFLLGCEGFNHTYFLTRTNVRDTLGRFLEICNDRKRIEKKNVPKMKAVLLTEDYKYIQDISLDLGRFDDMSGKLQLFNYKEHGSHFEVLRVDSHSSADP